MSGPTPSGLRARIQEAIRVNGPMPVSLYMLMCLHDPRDGYYATRPGFNHDFTTAPETSQVFGELLGLWVAHEWMRLGSPEKFWLIELGPGRGTMMADLLRAASSVKGFSAAVQVALVEASPALRKQQAHILARYDIHHFDELGSVPTGPSIIVANEFLDCLAIRQFVPDQKGGIHGLAAGFYLRVLTGEKQTAPLYHTDYREEHDTGDEPYRYTRW